MRVSGQESPNFCPGPHVLFYNSSRVGQKLPVQNKRMSKRECCLIIKVHLLKSGENCFFDFSIVGKPGFRWDEHTSNIVMINTISTRTSDCGNASAEVRSACSAVILSQQIQVVVYTNTLCSKLLSQKFFVDGHCCINENFFTGLFT